MRRFSSFLLIPCLLLLAGPPSARAFPGTAGNNIFHAIGDPYPRIVHQVFYYIEKKYVEPDRAEPRKLVEAALEALETRYPKVVVGFDAQGGDGVTVRVDASERRYDLGPARGSFSKAADTLNTVLQGMAKALGEDVKKKELYYFALNGALGELDPHSNVFSPKHFKEFMIGTRGSFGGIGFVFGIRDGEMTIITPIDGTPADRGGLASGDHILYIDGEPTINMPVDQAANKMRGEPGTQVTLTISREAWSEPKAITFTREIIHVDSVESYVLEGDGLPPVLYAKVKNFQKNTTDELRSAVAKARKSHPDFAGLVLDLRNDPGGLLDQAIALSDGFLDGGTIVSTRGPEKSANSRAVAKADEPISTKPLVVLVNQGSASASEIVAGALKASRALVIGQKTFGKGSVQKLYPLTDGGALKLTVAQYLTPGDISIQSIGIEPDVALYPARVEGDRLRIGPPPDHMGEADLENAFTEWGNASAKPWVHLQYLEPARDESEKSFAELGKQQKRARLAEDFPLVLARRVLDKARGNSRKELLEAARPVLEAVRAEQDAAITRAFEGEKVDWSVGPADEAAHLVVSGGAPIRLEAGTEASVAFTVRNEGKASAYRVWGRTTSTNPLLKNLDFAFGRLGPGEERTWSTRVKVPRSTQARWDTVHLGLRLPGGEEGPEGVAAAQTVPTPQPDYVYRYRITDENSTDPARSGDGLLEVGERVHLGVEVENRGAGVGDKLVVNIRGEEKEELYLEKARHRFENVAPGARVEAPMEFRVVDAQEDGQIRVTLSLADQEFAKFFADTLKFEAGKPFPEADARVPPVLTLPEAPPLRVDTDKVSVKIEVSDDEAVQDFYAYLGDKKLQYVRNAEGKNPLTLSLDVPLETGSNRVVLVARDQKDIQASRTLFIYRASPGDPPGELTLR